MLRRLLLVLVVLVAAWLVACAVLFVWPPAETGAPKHADVVVMLSGDHARLPVAEALIRRGVARTLALSSVRNTPGWTAAERLCRAGRYDGARVLCFEASPYSTRGEARAIARLARAHGWRRVVVVSSTFHLTRASMLVGRCYHGLAWYVATPTHWRYLPIAWATETGKLIVQLTAERSC